jgi:sirohydrochlorin ferrochelatase
MVAYVLVGFLSILLGILYVGYLTTHPLKMSRFLAGAMLTLVLIVAVIGARFSGSQVWLAAGLALAGFIVGYLGMARVVLSRDDSRPIPTLVRKPEDPGAGHTAVVYFTHGEPETFDPIGWLNQFREFDEQKIPFVPFFARPFFIHALRKKYLAVGRSEHRSIHHKMIRSLEESYRRDGDETTRFYLSFLDDNPRPDAALIRALNEGASRVVVCEVFLTVSNHTAEGKHQIAAVLEHFPDLPVEYTGPMYDSITLQRMFVQRASRVNGVADRTKVGVLLVGHGQPDEWDQEWPTETEHEIGFRMDVLKHFESEGYKRENISLAWMEFKEPKPAKKLEEFVKNGVEEILYFPAAISADSIHSQYDIPELVHMARIPHHIPLKNLGAWNDDPIVIQAIKEKVDRAIEALAQRV